ncbi:carbohydrate kinase [Mariniflexile soesokkakense]|uniref:Carbohydrate kinase n=1 Tax=Mariniflexile soesokkakense TaxID=1343160 RepID=A0ABV0AEH2_9FLAO
MANITCFGEVLWDVFPTHKKIGGAPLNVAARLQGFGNAVSMVSRIGEDKRGNRILDFFKSKGVNTDGIQIDKNYKTGKVKVMLNDKGSASYDIMFPRAWDKIELTDATRSIVEESDAFVFGSLVARDDMSRDTLYELLKLAKYKIFDINLRPPYYSSDVLNYLMNQANFIKFNDDEIFEISGMFDSKSPSLEQTIQIIAEQTNTKTICVTKGKHGAVLFVDGKFYYNSGYHINVIDTVGAGDSFLASLISKLLNSDNPQESINYACAVGAIVASREGANPEIKEEEINKMINA